MASRNRGAEHFTADHKDDWTETDLTDRSTGNSPEFALARNFALQDTANYNSHLYPQVLDKQDHDTLQSSFKTYDNAVNHPIEPYEHNTEFIAQVAAEHVFSPLHDRIDDTDHKEIIYDHVPTTEELGHRAVAHKKMTEFLYEFSSVLASDREHEEKTEILASVYDRARLASYCYANNMPMEGETEFEYHMAYTNVVHSQTDSMLASFADANASFALDNAMEITRALADHWEQRIADGTTENMSNQEFLEQLDSEFSDLRRFIIEEHTSPKSETDWPALPEFNLHDHDSMMDFYQAALLRVYKKTDMRIQEGGPAENWQTHTFDAAHQNLEQYWDTIGDQYERSPELQFLSGVPGFRSIISKYEEFTTRNNEFE